MKEWNVYIDGKYVGSVHAATEQAARNAAFSKYEVPDEADLSVSKR